MAAALWLGIVAGTVAGVFLYAMAQLIGSQPFHGLRFAGQHYDCGGRLGFIEANIAFGMSDDGIGADVQKIVKKYAQDL